MAYQIEKEVEAAETVVLTDRRRPGRVDYQNPHLLPLLRHGSGSDEELPELDASFFAEHSERGGDSLSAARGILIGCAISASLWVAAGLAIHFL